jgi:lipopolysaccharide/colanic/teichoic acid biosynthesis glycosyltransferase
VKRLFDIAAASLGLVLCAPILLLAMLAVWAQDFRSPLYIAPRVGRESRIFRMVKLRSMVIGADRTGISSTSANDRRITPIGAFVRATKLDELPQLWNVLVGDMSIVGPRPNVEAGVAVYTAVERKLLSVRPGITDFSSIVFADEGQILRDSRDPDRDYDLLIRPWKSRLGLFYVSRASFLLDIRLILITLLALGSRRRALDAASSLLAGLGADKDLVQLARRTESLVPAPHA